MRDWHGSDGSRGAGETAREGRNGQGHFGRGALWGFEGDLRGELAEEEVRGSRLI